MWKRKAKWSDVLYLLAVLLIVAGFLWLFTQFPSGYGPGGYYERRGSMILAAELGVLAQSAALFGFGLLAGYLAHRCK
jgi:hypothetical protein